MDLRWILVFISILIVAAIAWHTSRVSPTRFIRKFLKSRTKPRSTELDFDEDYSLPDHEAPVVQAHKDILCIHIKARPGHCFGGEKLVIQLNRTGMRLGEFDIFHYEHVEHGHSYKLFSLASSYEPGTFDMDRIEDFKTEGLSLFMQTEQAKDIRHVFETMLSTAQTLAEHLHAELYDEHWRPLSDMNLSQYYKHINNIEQLRYNKPLEI